jgi:hypothetical protein
MPRLLVSLACLWSLAGCAAMHAVTGDPMFRPKSEQRQVIRGPNVPEPEPTEPQFEAELKAAEEDALPPLPKPKKKSENVAKK